MKAWHLENFGLDNLKQVEVDKPKINENQILVKVNSVSLNYRDTVLSKVYIHQSYSSSPSYLSQMLQVKL